MGMRKEFMWDCRESTKPAAGGQSGGEVGWDAVESAAHNLVWTGQQAMARNKRSGGARGGCDDGWTPAGWSAFTGS